MAPVNLTSLEEQLERYSLSPDQGGYDSHPSVGVYHSPLFSSAMATAGVSDCFPSGNPVKNEDSRICGQTILDHMHKLYL